MHLPLFEPPSDPLPLVYFNFCFPNAVSTSRSTPTPPMGRIGSVSRSSCTSSGRPAWLRKLPTASNPSAANFSRFIKSFFEYQLTDFLWFVWVAERIRRDKAAPGGLVEHSQKCASICLRPESRFHQAELWATWGNPKVTVSNYTPQRGWGTRGVELLCRDMHETSSPEAFLSDRWFR